MRKVLLSPLFLVGLGVKLMLVLIVLPVTVTELYVPFLEVSISKFTFDPWSNWLGQQGSLVAFPYGYAMWLAFLPMSILCDALGLPIYLGYGFTLLLADIGLLIVFGKLLSPGKNQLLLAIYWLSPITLVASYLLGYNDLVPVLLLVVSIYLTQHLNLFAAGFFLIFAISAKLSMVLALPFFVIYFMHARALHQRLIEFFKGMALASFVFILPFLLSNAGMQMLFSNPEMEKVYQFSLTIGQGSSVYVFPLVFLAVMYAAWRVKRMNFELFQSVLGMAFLLVILLTPASPGWFIWTIPLLVTYQAMSDRVSFVLSATFSILCALGMLFALLPMQFSLAWAVFEIPAPVGKLEFLISFSNTLMVGIGTILALRVWRETVSRNDFFRLSRRPFVIGIAGDSGTGKDTLVESLSGLFGDHSVAKISGDDYHHWDRQKPIWQVMTHLNPMANDLENFSKDLVALIDGKSIEMRHYDHKTGIRGEKLRLKSNDFIIVSGLHALYLPILRRCLNLSIYLDMDENLRQYLKKKRDVGVRGHSVEKVLSSIEKRVPDAEKFIRPQAEYSDLVLSLQPINDLILAEYDESHSLRFKLVARSKNGFNEFSLTRVLVGICGLHVDMVATNGAEEVTLIIEGECSEDDVALAANILCPRIIEFMDINPKWDSGILGLMQLVVLNHINQVLTKRFI
jgi:uridine kinase